MECWDKYEILQCIANCVPENASGEDEENLLQNFLPSRSYSKLADNKTFLVTGGRGAGKSELFRILTSCEGLNHILGENDKKRYTDLKESVFIIGYIATGEESRKFPAPNICTKWIKGKTMLMEKKEFLEYLDPSCWFREKRSELPGNNKEEIS